jgi:hypothetical protein
MSKISLEGNASGSGTLTIAAPNTNSNFTLSLPTNTGTIITQNSTPAFASTIGVGGATAAASGAGITFPATQSASSDANTLDDYEEGDWTAVLQGSTSNPSGTYSNQTGKYTKIGRTVFVAFQIVLNSGFSAGSGSIRISGLPFTSNFEVFGGNFCQEFNSNSYVLNHASMHIGNNVAYMDMFFNRQNDGFTNYKWADISTGNTMYLYGSMTYQVA